LKNVNIVLKTIGLSYVISIRLFESSGNLIIPRLIDVSIFFLTGGRPGPRFFGCSIYIILNKNQKYKLLNKNTKLLNKKQTLNKNTNC